MVILKPPSVTSYSWFPRFYLPGNYIEIQDYGLTAEMELGEEHL